MTKVDVMTFEGKIVYLTSMSTSLLHDFMFAIGHAS